MSQNAGVLSVKRNRGVADFMLVRSWWPILQYSVVKYRKIEILFCKNRGTPCSKEFFF